MGKSLNKNSTPQELLEFLNSPRTENISSQAKCQHNKSLTTAEFREVAASAMELYSAGDLEKQWQKSQEFWIEVIIRNFIDENKDIRHLLEDGATITFETENGQRCGFILQVGQDSVIAVWSERSDNGMERMVESIAMPAITSVIVENEIINLV